MLPQRVVAAVLTVVATALLLCVLHLSLPWPEKELADAAALPGQPDWRSTVSALAARTVFVPIDLKGDGSLPPAAPVSPPLTPSPLPPSPPPPPSPPAPSPPAAAAGSSSARDLSRGNNNPYPSEDEAYPSRSLPYTVTAFPPASPTVSTYRWVSFGTPLWQGVVEAKGQTSDFTSVCFSNGRMTLFGLKAEQQAELQRWFEPFMHFDGTTQRYDKVEDVLGFDPRPLNWQTDCDSVEERYAFFVTPWMTMLHYHVVCEHVINSFANVRSANALPPPPFASPVLHSHHPRSVFTLPEPLRYPERTEFSPFEVPHLSNASAPVLYVFTRWHHMQSSAALSILDLIFPGGMRVFDQLQTGKRICFRRVRFGRGPPFHYFNKTFPFPLPPSHPLYSSPLRHGGNISSLPEDASWLASHDISLYNEIELGKWAGAMIDYQHWMQHHYGVQRRVRESRHRHTHMPLPGPLPVPPTPRVLLLRRVGAERGRFIANPQCLRDALGALSPPVELHYFTDYGAPMAAQLAAYRDADVLVGLHGAGFTNMLYMAPGGLVVELQTSFHFDNNFFGPLTGHLDHTHLRIDVRPFLNANKQDAGHVLDAAICGNISQQIMSAWGRMHQDRAWRFRNVYT